VQWRGVGHPKKWGGGLRAAGRAGPGKHACPGPGWLVAPIAASAGPSRRRGAQ
jgi:hypothetical protein